MFTRRSPTKDAKTASPRTDHHQILVLPGKTFAALCSNGNGNHPSSPNADKGNNNNHHVTQSPSRNGAKPKRSFLDEGRLCLLRSRGKKPCWYGFWILCALVAGTTATLVIQLQNPALLGDPARPRMTYDSTTRATSTTTSSTEAGENRMVLFQDISSFGIVPSQWRKFKGISLFRRAGFQPKPLVMGFILVGTTQESAMANYNLNRRKWNALGHLRSGTTSQNEKLSSSYASNERFQVSRINPQNHDMVEVVYAPESPDGPAVTSLVRSSDKPTWKFENVMVRNIGTGIQAQNDINDNSNDYNRNKPDDPPEGCAPQYPWQTSSFPTCNSLHEIDVITRMKTLNPAQEPEYFLLARGGYRDVWYVENTDLPGDIMGEIIAMKTLLYEHPWTERNMDRHRRDALATERLTGSPYALNLYGYCANTGLYDFAEGGSLQDAVENDTLWQKWTSADRITYAYQVACAIADVHNIDHEGLPSMSHTDISMSQFVSTDNGVTFQINDFNRARFIYHKNDTAEICPFDVASNKGRFRSPEEYAYKPETIAIDNYSMGNIFYVLLTRTYPFEDRNKAEAQEAVKKGLRPVIPDESLHSDDPLVQALVTAINKCWTQDPKTRATSREIQQYLKPFAEGIDKGKNTRRRKLSTSTSL